MDEGKARVVTRTDAANQAIMGLSAGNDAVPVERLAAWVEDVVVSSAGKPDPAATLRAVTKALKAAETYGVVKLHKTTTVERIG